jgi:hypothetical protein
MRAYEMRAYEMHAYEMHTYEMHDSDIHESKFSNFGILALNAKFRCTASKG